MNVSRPDRRFPSRRVMAPLIAAVGVVVAMSLALLERKYAVFSGGFLQANPIQGMWAQARFGQAAVLGARHSLPWFLAGL